MCRSVPAWTLLVAFLVTTPVAGAVRCPCHLAGLLRPVATRDHSGPAARPTACKCCEHREDATPRERGEFGSRPPLPADPPCDHGPGIDLAPTGLVGERAAEVCGGPVEVAAVGPLPPAPAEVAALPRSPPPPLLGPPPLAELRFTHAFRS
jgi:hypothetical protein